MRPREGILRGTLATLERRERAETFTPRLAKGFRLEPLGGERLERGAMAASARFATRRDALGVLVGSRASFYLTKRESALGRGTEDSKVDVDLSVEGNASKVSRQQAFVKLRWNGEFCVRNVGRRPVWINDVALESGRRCALAPQSLVEVGGMRLLWIPNPKLVRKTAPDPF